MTMRSSTISKDRRWDVIVVGARVAGAATAMLLARAGLRVLCVDRSRYGGDTVSTHALMRGGVLQLQRWGVLDAVADAGTPPVRRTVFHYGAESVVVSIRPSAGVDALYAPRRTVIDALLVDAAQRAGATVEFGATVAGLHRDGDGQVTGVVIDDRRAGIDRGSRQGRAGAAGHRRGRKEFPGGPHHRRRTWTCRPAGEQFPVRVLGGFPLRWVRMVLPPGSDRRCDTHQCRPDLCLRRRPTRSDRGVGERAVAVGRVPPARRPGRDRLPDPRCRTGGAGPVRQGTAARLPASGVRPRMGAGGGRGALDRPDQHARDDGGAAGRGTAVAGRALRAARWRTAAVRAGRLPGHPRSAVPADAAGDRGNRFLPVGSHAYSDVAAHACPRR